MSADNHDELDDLGESLRELGATPEQLAAWLPVVRQLDDWPDERITPADHGRLLTTLASALPQCSSVRQAIHERLARRSRLVAMLSIVHSQVSVLRPAFWILSAMLVALGVIIELAPYNAVSLVWLRALTPLLAYYSVASLFRSTRLQTLEWELACPPSPLQLISARLVIVLGYDVALGLALSLAGWLSGEGSFLVVTLHWLTPLLLIAGLALVLSLRLPILFAAGLAYSCWLALLALDAGGLNTLLSFQGELLLILVGLALLGFALWRVKRQIPNHFLPALSPM